MKTNIRKIKEKATTAFTIAEDVRSAEDEKEEFYDEISQAKWVPLAEVEAHEKELREEIKRLKDAVDTARSPYEAACFLTTAQKLEELLGDSE